MNKGIIYCTKIREEYEGAHMEHMIAEKLLEIALKKEYGINLYNEPRAEGEHGKPFLSYRPSLHYNISLRISFFVCLFMSYPSMMSSYFQLISMGFIAHTAPL